MTWANNKTERTLTGRPWRRLRARVLARDCYLCQCEDCAKLFVPKEADEVDHIISLSQGGDDSLDNLRAINSDCHKAKTQKESGSQMKTPIGVDGWPI